MDAKSLKNAAALALTIGVGIWTWQAIVTPVMSRLGIMSFLSDTSA